MTKASRRIFFYWLLLIIPTLAVGAGALWLLHREQVRINEQAAAAATAREAAVQARTRLIAENIGLLMTDVQSGLMATLNGAPVGNPNEYLDNWRRTNPLVHDVFVATPAGELRWGKPASTVKAWLATTPWPAEPQATSYAMDFIQMPSITGSLDRDADTRAQSRFIAEETKDIAAGFANHTIDSAQPEKKSDMLEIAAAPISEAPQPVPAQTKASQSPPPVAEKIVIDAKNEKVQADLTDNLVQYQNARMSLQEVANYNINRAPSSPNISEEGKLQSKVADKKISSARAPSKTKSSSTSSESRKSAASGAPVVSERSRLDQTSRAEPAAIIATPPEAEIQASIFGDAPLLADKETDSKGAWMAAEESAIYKQTEAQTGEISAVSDMAVSGTLPQIAFSALTGASAMTEINADGRMDTDFSKRDDLRSFQGNIAGKPAAETNAYAPERSQVGSDKQKDFSRGAPAPTPTEYAGWTPWTDANGELHLFGWRLTARNTVLVVEVNLLAIASRLGEVLPANIPSGEAYALRQTDGSLLAQSGFGPSPETDTTQPFNFSLSPSPALPGWTISGYTLADPSGMTSGSSRAFVLMSGLLVGLFILSIIGGGSLLMRQARLSAAESAQKTSFVANVSHEFKTPLTTIRLYSELLEQGRIRDDAKRAESLQTISRETQRLARLVNNVLDFSRLEQGRKKFDLAEHDLHAEISRIIDRHSPRIAEAGLHLNFESDDSPCIAKTDLDAVEQIVINLLDNACKYAASGEEITVMLRKQDADQPTPASDGTTHHPRIAITVADRGPGIPSSHRDKIFEKFHRVDDTLTASQGGAGLGLSIARQLARGLGGDLTYTPRDGGGSKFTLLLP